MPASMIYHPIVLSRSERRRQARATRKAGKGVFGIHFRGTKGTTTLSKSSVIAFAFLDSTDGSNTSAVSGSDYVYNLLWTLHLRQEIPSVPSDVALYLSGRRRPLCPFESLRDAGIGSGSTLTLSCRLRGGASSAASTSAVDESATNLNADPHDGKQHAFRCWYYAPTHSNLFQVAAYDTHPSISQIRRMLRSEHSLSRPPIPRQHIVVRYRCYAYP